MKIEDRRDSSERGLALSSPFAKVFYAAAALHTSLFSDSWAHNDFRNISNTHHYSTVLPQLASNNKLRVEDLMAELDLSI